VRVANLPIDLVNAFHYTMPAYSVSTLVLRDAKDGDFNVDGAVNGQDLTLWSASLDSAAGLILPKATTTMTGSSAGPTSLAWQRGRGSAGVTAAQSAIPEPASVLVAAGGLSSLRVRRRRSFHFAQSA